MDEKKNEEFTLEDIIEEFRDEEGSVPEKSADDILDEILESTHAEEDTQVFDPQKETPPADLGKDGGMDGSTVRIHLPSQAQVYDPSGETPRAKLGEDGGLDGSTVRIHLPEKLRDQEAAMNGDTVRLETPVQEEETPPEEEPTPEAPAAEPFSDRWEPDYEEPIPEYKPIPPLELRPASRRRELKKDLVAGPERMYYALSEKGLGKLQLAIVMTLLVVLTAAASTVFYVLGMVGENRMKLMVFVQFLSMLVAALFGSFQLLEGGADLLKGRFSLNSLLCFSFLFCTVDGVLCLQTLRLPCCAGFSLLVLMSLWNEYHKRNTRMGLLDTMRKATRLDSLSPVEDYYDGRAGFLRGEGQVREFMDTLDQPAGPEKVLSVYALVALGVSVALGVTAGILHGVHTGIQVAAVTTLAAMPASIFVTLSRPMAVLERRLHRLGVVLCGWQGVKALSEKAVFPVTHNDLFPTGTVKLNGMKFFGNAQPDTVISYAAALAQQDGGTLEPLFTHLLDSRNGIHYDVESFHAYENGGVGGEVNGEAVLMGSLPFLKEMGVETPEGIRVSRAVCVAVDGELCGLFATTYEADRASASGLSSLSGYRKLKPVIVSDDMMLTGEFIRELFNVRPKQIELPEHAQRQELRDKTAPEDTPAAALITGQGLAPFAYAVTGARTLRSACHTGVVIHMVGGIAGMVAMGILAVLGATAYLTPANLFAYELLWMIPGLLITSWTRSL